MILRNILVHLILPLIILSLGILGIISPEKIDKHKWTTLPYNFERLNKNKNTVRTAILVSGICFLVEGVFYSVFSIMVLYGKIKITGFEEFLIILVMFIIIPFLLMYIVNIIKFDKNGEKRRKNNV